MLRAPSNRRVMDTFIRIAIYVGIGYVLIVILAACFQRSLLYFPDQNLPAPQAVGATGFAAVRLTTTDGLDLTSWYLPPRSEENPVIVLFHGNAGNIAHRLFKAVPLASSGYGILLLEYRGYGGNPGSPTEEGLYHDGRAAIAFLRANGVFENRIVLYGESLGSGVAVQMATEITAGALILEAPYTSIPEVAGKHYPILPTEWLTKDKFRNKDKITDLNEPLLIVHGAKDDIIPVQMGRQLYALAPTPKKSFWVLGAGHNDVFGPEVADEVLMFIDKYVNG